MSRCWVSDCLAKKRNQNKFENYIENVPDLHSGNVIPENKLVTIKTKGGLISPSQTLFGLLNFVEENVTKHSTVIKKDIFHLIISDVFESNDIVKNCVGCKQHYIGLTSRVVNFYITSRIHFKCRNNNRNLPSRVKRQSLEKQSNLI